MLRLDFVGRARVATLKWCECEMSVRDAKAAASVPPLNI